MKEKGFTLIELLIVIAIIGILSSIVLISIGSASNSAKDAANRLELRQFHLIARRLGSGNITNLCGTIRVGDTDVKTDGRKIVELIYERLGGSSSSYVSNTVVGCRTFNTGKWVVAVKSLEESSTDGNNIYFCIDSTSNVVKRVDTSEGELYIGYANVIKKVGSINHGLSSCP